MTDELLPAVQETAHYIDSFTRTGYSAAFRAYTEQYAAAFRKALRAGNRAAIAAALVEAVEAGRKQERFWKRGTRACAEKQMVVVYLCPMLAEIGEAAFAEELRQAWERRWPKDGFKIATFKQIKDGFRDTIFGLELRRRQDD